MEDSVLCTTRNISNLTVRNSYIASVEFAFDLDNGFRSGKPAVRCLLPVAALFLLNMHYAEIEGRGCGVYDNSGILCNVLSS